MKRNGKKRKKETGSIGKKEKGRKKTGNGRQK